MEQGAEVFTEVNGEEEFMGEIAFYEDTQKLIVSTPDADYEFVLSKVIPK